MSNQTTNLSEIQAIVNRVTEFWPSLCKTEYIMPLVDGHVEVGYWTSQKRYGDATNAGDGLTVFIPVDYIITEFQIVKPELNDDEVIEILEGTAHWDWQIECIDNALRSFLIPTIPTQKRMKAKNVYDIADWQKDLSALFVWVKNNNAYTKEEIISFSMWVTTNHKPTPAEIEQVLSGVSEYKPENLLQVA